MLLKRKPPIPTTDLFLVRAASDPAKVETTFRELREQYPDAEFGVYATRGERQANAARIAADVLQAGDIHLVPLVMPPSPRYNAAIFYRQLREGIDRGVTHAVAVIMQPVIREFVPGRVVPEGSAHHVRLDYNQISSGLPAMQVPRAWVMMNYDRVVDGHQHLGTEWRWDGK